MFRWVIPATNPKIFWRMPKSTHVHDERGDGEQLARHWQLQQPRICCPQLELRHPCAEEVQLHLIQVSDIHGHPFEWDGAMDGGK
jgi:hypothetical protein